MSAEEHRLPQPPDPWKRDYPDGEVPRFVSVSELNPDDPDYGDDMQRLIDALDSYTRARDTLAITSKQKAQRELEIRNADSTVTGLVHALERQGIHVHADEQPKVKQAGIPEGTKRAARVIEITAVSASLGLGIKYGNETAALIGGVGTAEALATNYIKTHFPTEVSSVKRNVENFVISNAGRLSQKATGVVFFGLGARYGEPVTTSIGAGLILEPAVERGARQTTRHFQEQVDRAKAFVSDKALRLAQIGSGAVFLASGVKNGEPIATTLGAGMILEPAAERGVRATIRNRAQRRQ